MKPARFEYLRAHSVEEAVKALADAGDEGKILAGGQSLTPMLALRMARPELVVDINRISSLSTMDFDGGVFRIGALVRHARLAEQHDFPLLAEAARWIGHTAIRTRGTLGGSLAHADPAAELPVVAVALDATVYITGPGGERTCSARELFAAPLETTLAEDELITAVDLPNPSRWGFAELSRRHGDFGLVTVVAAEVDGHWRISVGGVAGVPHRATEAESILDCAAMSTDAIARAAAAAAADLDPASDIHASGEYRRAMTEELTRRALTSSAKGAA
jgi:carbon-monoxide dehydrogenase medium subunit